MKLYVEGGGDSNDLKTECRKGFSEFLRKSGLAGQMPRIIACGSRGDAYKSFCISIEKNEEAFLLVDSECPVAQENQGKPWQHLAQREGDKWEKPDRVTDEQCHLMVECMEAWLITDRATLSKFFAKDFDVKALPPEERSIESISKQDLYNSLKQATRKCSSSYNKGSNSFKLLALIDANLILEKSPWAERFISNLKRLTS